MYVRRAGVPVSQTSIPSILTGIRLLGSPYSVLAGTVQLSVSCVARSSEVEKNACMAQTVLWGVFSCCVLGPNIFWVVDSG